MIKAIIFDCFGVIRADRLLLVYESMGGDIEKDHDFIERTIIAVNKGLIASTVPIFAEKLGVSEAVWLETIQTGNGINQDVLDYALELRQKYKVGMLTNMSLGGLTREFGPGLLDKYFDVAVASGDIGIAKPEARAYEIIADMLGVRLDECVMIDDRQDYLDGAVAVGMRAVLFTSTKQLKNDLSAILAKA